MLYKSVLLALAVVGSTAPGLAPAAAAQQPAADGHPPTAVVPALKERTAVLPGGVAVAFGFENLAVRPVPPLNGMPTTRQAFLDDTAFARISGPATGVLTVGYEAACSVDVAPSVTLNVTGGLNGEALGGVEVAPGTAPLPSLDVSVGPSVGAAVTGSLIVTPGTEKTDVVDTGSVAAGPVVPFLDKNESFKVEGCGGRLTVRPYVTLVVCAPDAHYHDTVYGDPFTL